MPTPVIADVYKLQWLFSTSASPVNQLHVRCTATSDVADIVAAVGAAALTLTHNPFQALQVGGSVTSLRITPLDGVTAATDQPLGTSMGGSATGETIPNMAAVVSFQTAVRGPRGRGRMYIGPITESKQNGGALNGSDKSDMALGWAEFIAALVAGTPSVVPVVASYVHADANDIVSHRVNTKVGTQRRRLQRL